MDRKRQVIVIGNDLMRRCHAMMKSVPLPRRSPKSRAHDAATRGTPTGCIASACAVHLIQVRCRPAPTPPSPVHVHRLGTGSRYLNRRRTVRAPVSSSLSVRLSTEPVPGQRCAIVAIFSRSMCRFPYLLAQYRRRSECQLMSSLTTTFVLRHIVVQRLRAVQTTMRSDKESMESTALQ